MDRVNGISAGQPHRHRIRRNLKDFGPAEAAARTGISLRYLQKPFTERGSTCSEFIYSARLDHAARLFGRRESLRNGQPLSPPCSSVGAAGPQSPILSIL